MKKKFSSIDKLVRFSDKNSVQSDSQFIKRNFRKPNAGSFRKKARRMKEYRSIGKGSSKGSHTGTSESSDTDGDAAPLKHKNL